MSLLRSPRVCSLERETVFAGLSMKRMLVVLVGRDPVQTDALFERTLGCLAAEEQLRKAYRDALSGLR